MGPKQEPCLPAAQRRGDGSSSRFADSWWAWVGTVCEASRGDEEERRGDERVTICPRRAARSTGRCGVSPLEGVGPHAVGPRGRLSFTKNQYLALLSSTGLTRSFRLHKASLGALLFRYR